eukprot:6737709-Alexandrium_andersonii.AAC.1
MSIGRRQTALRKQLTSPTSIMYDNSWRRVLKPGARGTPTPWAAGEHRQYTPTSTPASAPPSN